MLFPSLVQSVAASTSSASPLSLTLPSPTTPGNCLIVCASGDAVTTNPVVTGVTLGGSAGNFAQAVTVGSPSSDFATTTQWADPGCAGGQTAVSIAFTSSGSLVFDAIVLELFGVFPSSPVDKTASQVNNSSVTSWSSTGTTATSQPTEVAVGCVGAFNGSGVGTLTGPSSPWINLPQKNSPNGAYGLLVGYQLLSSTGAVTYAGTSANAVQYSAAVVTYKASVLPSIQCLASQAVKRSAYY